MSTRHTSSWRGAQLITHRDNFTLSLTQVTITNIRVYKMAGPLEGNAEKYAGGRCGGGDSWTSFHGHSVDAEFPMLRQALNIRILNK
jgi:hypothetical protein